MSRATNERRPAVGTADLQGSRAASKRNHAQRTAQRSVASTADSLVPTRLEWAASLIDRVTGKIPEYGSPEFEALPWDSPVRVASCVRAAEAWRVYFSPEEIARRLRAEFGAAQKFELTQEQREDYARARPSFAELSARRGEPEAEARGRAHQRRLGLVPVG